MAVSEEILINVTPRETRVGIVENGMLQEVHVERASRRGYVGNIYKGRVQRVMPGMQAVFVDIGLDRAAFLHASDIIRPAIPGVELHARYLPAQDGAAVGGDWYDAFAQPDGSVMLAVGDVSGHDIEAAATLTSTSATPGRRRMAVSIFAAQDPQSMPSMRSFRALAAAISSPRQF